MANRYIPFGYEIVDAQVVIIEREAEVVRNVFSLYVRGNSLKTISERLIYAETFENICIYNERESHEKRTVQKLYCLLSCFSVEENPVVYMR